jgi:hypothetical protein
MDLPLSRSLVFYNLIGALGQFFAALFYHRAKPGSRAANRAAKQHKAGILQSILVSIFMRQQFILRQNKE